MYGKEEEDGQAAKDVAVSDVQTAIFNKRTTRASREMSAPQVTKKGKLIMQVAKQPALKYSIDELREMKSLTDAIRKNLETIDDYDLDALEKQAQSIAESMSNLETINADDTDLDKLEEQTANIVRNLETINKDDHDLDELEKQTENIVENLKQTA